MERTYKPVTILPVRVTIVNDGEAVIVEKKYTDKDARHIVGFAISYDHPENLAGSMINISIGGKSLFINPVDTSLFTFDTACPVNDRYYNLINEAVNNSAIGIEYTPGPDYPEPFGTVNTVITVSFQCTND